MLLRLFASDLPVISGTSHPKDPLP
jgi:hypothetical protein